MPPADSADNAMRLRWEPSFKLLVFVFLLILSAGLECGRLSSLQDPEIWGHIQVGSWILQHKTWPNSGLFSQAENLPWRDFRWGYDVIVATAYRMVNLRALPLLLMCFRIALALITFRLAGGWRNFWPAVLLSALGQYILFSVGPGPMFFSLLFFGLELLLLIEVRQTGRAQRLILLPFLFLLWANLDFGFVCGILVYLLFLVALGIEKWEPVARRKWVACPSAQIPIKSAIFAGSFSFLASLCNP